ncbi:MAG: phospho-sugar mutase, partial [Myxococcales bacterium]
LVLALAKEKKADLVLANDPDADRLAVAVPDGRGGYVQLSGDQVGALLGYYLLTEGGGGSERLVCTTIVSSALLGQMASQLGVQYAETLTGFKWIANRALELQQAKGYRFVLGYEEALGYTVGEVVRDKDGVSAAAVFAELAAHCHRRGQSVLQYLEELYRRFGLFRSQQHSATLPGSEGLSKIRGIMQALRETRIDAIGPVKVVASRDLKSGVRTSAEGTQKLELPSSDVLVYELDGGGRITVRPSGTEPKIKCYFELREAIAPGEPFADAQRRADARMAVLMKDFLALAHIP